MSKHNNPRSGDQRNNQNSPKEDRHGQHDEHGKRSEPNKTQEGSTRDPRHDQSNTGRPNR
jgi:hypothetical protein